jgi:hypothetical protein
MKHTLHITVPYQSVRYCNYCSGAITLTLLATLDCITHDVVKCAKVASRNLVLMETTKV